MRKVFMFAHVSQTIFSQINVLCDVIHSQWDLVNGEKRSSLHFEL